jgi:outer membrane protein assembly factor BamD
MSIRSWLTVSAISLAALGLAACDTTRDDSSKWPPERLYTEAKEEASAGAYEKAIKLYERLEGRAAGTVLAQQAQLERAFLLWKTAESAQALAVLERFLKLHPTSPAYDYALYLQGLINFNDSLGFLGSLAAQDLSERDQQASRDAYQSFRQLTERFPQSSYAEDARLRMNFIVNSLAAYEVTSPATLPARRQSPRPAGQAARDRVPELAFGGGALYIMTQSWPPRPDQLRDDADRVLRSRLSEHSGLCQRPRQQETPGGSPGEPRAQALSGATAASRFSHSIASPSRSRRAIGGNAANNLRP